MSTWLLYWFYWSWHIWIISLSCKLLYRVCIFESAWVKGRTKINCFEIKMLLLYLDIHLLTLLISQDLPAFSASISSSCLPAYLTSMILFALLSYWFYWFWYNELVCYVVKYCTEFVCWKCLVNGVYFLQRRVCLSKS